MHPVIEMNNQIADSGNLESPFQLQVSQYLLYLDYYNALPAIRESYISFLIAFAALFKLRSGME